MLSYSSSSSLSYESDGSSYESVGSSFLPPPPFPSPLPPALELETKSNRLSSSSSQKIRGCTYFSTTSSIYSRLAKVSSSTDETTTPVGVFVFFLYKYARAYTPGTSLTTLVN